MNDDKYTTLGWPWVSRFEPIMNDFILLGQKLSEIDVDFGADP